VLLPTWITVKVLAVVVGAGNSTPSTTVEV